MDTATCRRAGVVVDAVAGAFPADSTLTVERAFRIS